MKSLLVVIRSQVDVLNVTVFFVFFATGSRGIATTIAQNKELKFIGFQRRKSPKAASVIAFLDAQGQYGEMQPEKKQIHLNHPSRKMLYDLFREAESNSTLE